MADFSPNLGQAGESNELGKTNSFGTTGSSFVGQSKGLELEASSHRQFTQALISKGNGSLLRGWRSELDPDGTLQVAYPDFCQASKRLGLGLHLKRQSVVDRNAEGLALRLKDVAPDSYKLLQRFRDWVQSKGGPLQLMSRMDEGTGATPVDVFREYVSTSDFGATPKELDEIVGMCDVDQSGVITGEEIIFLEIDKRLRDVQVFKIKMKQKHTRQQLLATMYSTTSKVGNTKTKYRETLRPWQRTDFERLPQVELKKKRETKINKMRKAHKAKHHFISILLQKYGTVVRAWRRDLDKEGTFSVQPSTIRQFCARLPSPIDSALVLHALDEDGNQSIRLEELAPKAAAVLANFQRWAIDNFESCVDVWNLPDTQRARNAAPAPGSGWAKGASNKKLPLPVFAKVVTKLGWPLALDPEKLSILLANLDIFGCGFLSASDLAWLDKWTPPEWLYREQNLEALAEVRSRFEGMSALQAWQQYFDVDNSNRLSWDEFSDACERLGFTGDVGGAFRACDDDLSGSISLREFHRQTYEVLHSFKKWCEDHYGSVKLLFMALQKDISGEITITDLKRAATRLFWEGDVREVIDAVGAGFTPGKESKPRKVITYKELEFLDTWLPSRPNLLDGEDWHQISKSKSEPALLPRIGFGGSQTSQQAEKLRSKQKPALNAMFTFHSPMEDEDETSPRRQTRFVDPLRETSLGRWIKSSQPHTKSSNRLQTLPHF